MTKDQEIDLIARFVGELPSGTYLADLLANIPAECEALIKSDLAWPLTIRQAWDERMRLTGELENLREQINSRKIELSALNGKISRGKDELDNIRSAALTLARA